MGVRILDSEGLSTETGAVLFDSVSGWAFGPVFPSHEDAEEFLEAAPALIEAIYGSRLDLRSIVPADLEGILKAWQAGRPQEDEVTS